MKHLTDFPTALDVLADFMKPMRSEPYWQTEVFAWPVVYLAVYYRRLPNGGMSDYGRNIEAMGKFFPEAVPLYRGFIGQMDDYANCTADLAGFEFRSSLNTAESVNDLLGHLRGRRSVRWTSKDIHKAAVVTNELMAFLKEIPSGDVDINEVINKIRVDVEARLAGLHPEKSSKDPK